MDSPSLSLTPLFSSNAYWHSEPQPVPFDMEIIQDGPVTLYSYRLLLSPSHISDILFSSFLSLILDTAVKFRIVISSNVLIDCDRDLEAVNTIFDLGHSLSRVPGTQPTSIRPSDLVLNQLKTESLPFDGEFTPGPVQTLD